MSPAKLSTLTITTAVAAVALWSCSKNNGPAPEETGSQTQEQTSSSTATAGGGTMQGLRAECPMVVEGADVSVSETEEGVALVFTTKAGDVADLRARVQHMAQMYEMHRGRGGMMWHRMGRKGQGRGGPGMGRGHMAGRGPMPAATATVTEVDEGARLELRPTDPSQLDALREHARWHQQRMQSGECWMLQGKDTPGGTEEGAER